MIAVILPCYKSSKQVLGVLARIDKSVSEIILVDDGCPEETGKQVEQNSGDDRVRVIYHDKNRGIGAAMKTGFREALKGRCDIIVKIDSDGQMPPEIMQNFVDPIAQGQADYCKGNRFYSIESLQEMPWIRVLGNSALSFFNKFSSGYWNIMDPTNGYIAIHRRLLENLPVDKLEDRFFFETSMMFRLNTINALVVDIPMDAIYGDEKSNLSIARSILPFLYKHASLFVKRIFYNYFLRNFSIASINLLAGLAMFFGGGVYGLGKHLHFSSMDQSTPTGIQITTAIMLLIGFQLLLSFITHDMNREPAQSIHQRLPKHGNGG